MVGFRTRSPPLCLAVVERVLAGSAVSVFSEAVGVFVSACRFVY